MDILSTRGVAELLAVSEATVKRWADAGTLRCFRTPGGHRKFRMDDVADFLREHQYDTAIVATAPRASSEHSDLSRSAGPTAVATLRGRTAEEMVRFRNAALAGDSDGLLSQMAQSRLRGIRLAEIFDASMCPALVDVGELWARGVLTVTQEHLAANTVIDALARTRPLIERTDADRGKMLLACLGREQHDIGVRMASLLAYGVGYDARLIGACTPVVDLARMIASAPPRFVVVSASIATAPLDAERELAEVASASRAVNVPVIAGGAGYERIETLPTGVQFVGSMVSFVRAIDTDGTTLRD